MDAEPLLSLIVPTRQRPGPLRDFLASVAATAARPDLLEIVLVVDADDRESLAVPTTLAVRPVVVPPGLRMGALNRAGAAAARGDWLMLLNDDVAATTPDWDERLRACFREHPDGILLVHVNDGVFQDKLCTFPLVSRRYCELAGGICPTDYERYRIDDHIEETFALLGVLGERRIFYLPDVLFEHANYVTSATGVRQYFSDADILARDAPRFDALLSARKELALRLKNQIDRERLDAAPACRGPERLRIVRAPRSLRQKVRACVRQVGWLGMARIVLHRARAALLPGG